ncbi:hypothetical protein CLV28_0712 [Sediminihabitans luteus]|uniref:Uncharacterized protein n=1 Tax=Sediminihabitans luteus TaxID=1138585 RepID=A0A2M9D066_9CELL|nr:minor capsid protein [Sediminihabitans luteus]PJJ77493.1 hypothetical protein CLV28_0712 [Sediminihabitans luteus]GII98389.1 hypothetical protein Slu03_07670 [Sediminihabitans luteus]
MSWTSDLEAGLAEHLAAAGLGVWRPTGPAYTTAEVGIVTGRVPTAPDRVIVINAYNVTSGLLSHVTLGLQIKVRGPKSADPRPAQDLTDAIYDRLHGARDLTLAGIPVALLWRQSWAWLGPDANGRDETTSNYYAETAHPSAHVTD